MDSATIEKVATTAVIAGAAFLASKIFETGWKITTKRPVPAEDADDVTLTSLVIFAATSAALAAVAQRYAYKGSQKWLAPKLAARFGGDVGEGSGLLDDARRQVAGAVDAGDGDDGGGIPLVGACDLDVEDRAQRDEGCCLAHG